MIVILIKSLANTAVQKLKLFLLLEKLDYSNRLEASSSSATQKAERQSEAVQNCPKRMMKH